MPGYWQPNRLDLPMLGAKNTKKKARYQGPAKAWTPDMRCLHHKMGENCMVTGRITFALLHGNICKLLKNANSEIMMQMIFELTRSAAPKLNDVPITLQRSHNAQQQRVAEQMSNEINTLGQ